MHANGREQTPARLVALALVGLLVGCDSATQDRSAGPALSTPDLDSSSPRARSALLVTVDTLRADATAFGGNPRVETPAFDRVAAAGLVFSSARAHAVMTLPSHASILTGLRPYEHGIRSNSGFVLSRELATLATVLQAHGFATGAFVGAFPLDARFGLDRGFDVYDDRYGEGSDRADFNVVERRGDEVIAAALSWWVEHADERRFLWVHLFDPHTPYDPPAPYASRYADNPYLGEVAATDAYLAPLFEETVQPPGGTTLVVLTADHGEALGEHGERTHGLFAYGATLRVPLVVVAPGLSPGRTDTAVSHIDLMPTILDGLAVKAPDTLPGRSLLRPLGGDPPPIYFEALDANLNRGWAPLTGLVVGTTKAIALPIPELYDLSNDPEERHNLASVERERYREIVLQLPPEALAPPARGRVDSDQAQTLSAIGYVSGEATRRPSYGPEDDPKTLIELDQSMHRLIDEYHRGDLEAAVVTGRTIVARRPHMGVAYYHLAQALIELGRRPEALAVLEEGWSIGATYPAAGRQLGLLLAQAGRSSEGVRLLEGLAVDSDPETLNALGVVRSEAGDQEGAQRALELVFEADPRNPDAHQNLALVALRRQDWPEAERQARAALALSSELPQALNYLGVSLYHQGRPAQAVEQWERATNLAPDDFDLLFNLGTTAAEIGDRERAYRALERFVAQAPPARYRPDIMQARAILRQLEDPG